MAKDVNGLEIVRFYTEDDPVLAAVDNRPLEDLEQRDCDLFDMFDPVRDEVIDARGSLSTLDARLDVSINEDGTLKAAISFADNFLVKPSTVPDDEVLVQPGHLTKSDASGYLALLVDTATALSFPVVSALGQVRYDVLSIDDAGALNRTAGIETVAPGDAFINSPAPPPLELPLAIIRVLEDVTVVVAADDITDIREIMAVRGQAGIDSTHPGDDTFVAAPTNLEEDLDRIRNEIDETRGAADWETAPTRTLNAVEAEVTTARGSEASVDARLDVELRDDGIFRRFPNGYYGEIKILRDSVTPSTKLDIERCEVMGRNVAGATPEDLNVRLLQPAPNTILDATLIGVPNGLDAGALAPSTLYFIYAIGDSTDAVADATLLSTSAGPPFAAAPTLPVGYDLFRRIGVVPTDGGSLLIAIRKINGVTLYEDGAVPIVFSAAIGASAFFPVSLAAFVPALVAERAIIAIFGNTAVSSPDIIEFRSGSTVGPATYTIQTRQGVGGAAGNHFFSHDHLELEVSATATIDMREGTIGHTTTATVYVRGFVDDMKHF